MTTRAYVPNVDGEGSIGTTDKKWGAMYVASPDSTASDNRVASTAWVQSIVADALKSAKAEIYKQAKLDAHPVGSYYWSNDSTSPATLFGGTWEALPAGYTLIAQGSGTDDYGSFTYTAGQKYGERKHPLTTDELPRHTATSHFHTGFNSFCLNTPWNGNGASNSWKNQNNIQPGSSTAYSFNQTIDMDLVSNPVGGDVAHNNLQPSVGAYGWRRTA